MDRLEPKTFLKFNDKGLCVFIGGVCKAGDFKKQIVRYENV